MKTLIQKQEELTQKREEFLLDTLQYYVTDVNRRCADKQGTCRYDPQTAGKENISDGCAIGRHMTLKNKALADNYGMVGSLPKNLIPKKLLNLKLGFLLLIQNLHDMNGYWNKEGLTKNGKKYVNYIIAMYSLNPTLFTKYI